VPTPSHTCTYSAREAIHRFASPILGIAVIVVALHGARLAHLLPDPVPSDLERTLIAAKVKLASHPVSIPVVLLGDSSCMMNADAPALARKIGVEVLNLGTFSHLDLKAHAALLRRRLQQSLEAPRDILLLLHPSALKRSSSEPPMERYLLACLADDPRHAESLPRHPIEAVLGGVMLRERILQPWVPVLLKNEFATAYGTTWNVRRRIASQSGSLVDPTPFDPATLQGRYEFTLGTGFQAACTEFRSAVPAASRLWVGLTPLPKSLALPGHAEQVSVLLQSLADSLAPAQALRSLPSTLPDSLFATATHLNSRGVEAWTETLAQALIANPAADVQPVRSRTIPNDGAAAP